MMLFIGLPAGVHSLLTPELTHGVSAINIFDFFLMSVHLSVKILVVYVRLLSKKNDVLLWANEKKVVQEINLKNKNNTFLKLISSFHNFDWLLCRLMAYK